LVERRVIDQEIDIFANRERRQILKPTKYGVSYAR